MITSNRIEMTISAFLVLVVLFLGLKSFKINDKSTHDTFKTVLVVNSTKANMRSKPNKKSKIIAVAPEKSMFTQLSKKGDWLEVLGDGKRGWIHKSLLGKYFHLPYFKDYTINESTFQMEF